VCRKETAQAQCVHSEIKCEVNLRIWDFMCCAENGPVVTCYITHAITVHEQGKTRNLSAQLKTTMF
jgi:hypothetical protein